MSYVISATWGRKLRHRHLPKIIQRCDFKAHVRNYGAMLRCQDAVTDGRKALRKEKSRTYQEDDGTITRNLNRKTCWFLWTQVANASALGDELFKGGNPEITHGFPKVAHVRLHRHQIRDEVKIVESPLSITCLVMG